jgi:hypothetical protein
MIEEFSTVDAVALLLTLQSALKPDSELRQP